MQLQNWAVKNGTGFLRLLLKSNQKKKVCDGLGPKRDQKHHSRFQLSHSLSIYSHENSNLELFHGVALASAQQQIFSKMLGAFP